MFAHDLLVAFVRSADDCSALVDILCEGYTELLNLQQEEFETTLVSDTFVFHLDTFLRFAWYEATDVTVFSLR